MATRVGELAVHERLRQIAAWKTVDALNDWIEQQLKLPFAARQTERLDALMAGRAEAIHAWRRTSLGPRR